MIELFTNATFADDPLSLMIGGGPDYSKRENGFDGFRAFVTHLQTALSDELYWSLNVSEVMLSKQKINQEYTPLFIISICCKEAVNDRSV